jgi:hypothetical protein
MLDQRVVKGLQLNRSADLGSRIDHLKEGCLGDDDPSASRITDSTPRATSSQAKAWRGL